MTQQAAIYERLSDDKAGDELGVVRQGEDCDALLGRRGWSLYDRFRDNDRSAKHADTRPDFKRLLEAVRDGSVHVIVAWSWDRLTRNRRETVELIEACQEHGVLIALVKGSDIDCSTAAGRLVADVLASVARNEIDQKSERQVRAYRQAAEAGKPHYVARPYGYTRRGEINEEEAAVLRDIAQKYLLGWGLTEIKNWLNRGGIPSATGGLWSNRVVRDHLLSKRNAGIRVYKGEEFTGTWTPVFDLDLHERLVAENKRRPDYVSGKHSNRRRYLLTGLLFCGKCGQRMIGHRRADHAGKPMRDKYNCVGLEHGTICKGQIRVAETLDHFVREAVLFRLDSPEMAELLAQNEKHAERIEPLRSRSDALKGKLDALLIDYYDETLSKPEYQRLKKRAEVEREAVERELASLYSSQQAAAILDAGTTLRQAWDQQSIGWQRKLLGMVVERIVVNPSTKRTPYYIDGKLFKFSPDDVDISWIH